LALALIAAVLPHWVLPAVVPAARQETGSEVSGLDGWKQRFSIAAISLALLAITLAVFSILRREEKLYAGVAAALSASAIAFQLIILLAGALLAIAVLYAVLKQPDSASQLIIIPIGAAIVFLIIAVLAMGLISPLLAALAGGAAIVILIIYSILNGF
jgi:hypothetical protein